MTKPFTLFKGTPFKAHHYRGYTIGERVEVREGPRAGQFGYIARLRTDGRPVLRFGDGVLINGEDAGQWVRPDLPVVEIVYEKRCGFPMGPGDIKRRAGAL